MAGIVGTAEADRQQTTDTALGAIAHRGRAGRVVISEAGATLGCVWPGAQAGFNIGHRTYPVVLDGEIHNWTDLVPGATCVLEALYRAYLLYTVFVLDITRFEKL